MLDLGEMKLASKDLQNIARKKNICSIAGFQKATLSQIVVWMISELHYIY